MSDALKGIEESKTQYFFQSELQFCVVHLECNLLSSVKPSHKKEVCEDLKEVFQTGNPKDSTEQAKGRFRAFYLKWGKYYPDLYRF